MYCRSVEWYPSALLYIYSILGVFLHVHNEKSWLKYVGRRDNITSASL